MYFVGFDYVICDDHPIYFLIHSWSNFYVANFKNYFNKTYRAIFENMKWGLWRKCRDFHTKVSPKEIQQCCLGSIQSFWSDMCYIMYLFWGQKDDYLIYRASTRVPSGLKTILINVSSLKKIEQRCQQVVLLLNDSPNLLWQLFTKRLVG